MNEWDYEIPFIIIISFNFIPCMQKYSFTGVQCSRFYEKGYLCRKYDLTVYLEQNVNICENCYTTNSNQKMFWHFVRKVFLNQYWKNK